MEQATGYVLGPRKGPKEPGEIARHSMQHVARGSTGVMFFQWRASRGGAEQWHPGMVPHTGPDSRVFREVSALGEALERIPAPYDGPLVEAEAAILWDEEAWWAAQGPGLPSSEIDYLAAVQQAHRVLWRQGVPTCFAHPSHDLPAYRAVLVPSLYLISDEAARNLAAYVEGGGTLVVSFFSGITDEHTRIRLGGYPGALREILGITVEEFRPLGEPVELPEFGRATLWSEVVHLDGAEAVARYPGGGPAVTCHRLGDGTAWYVSTRLDDPGYAQVLTRAGLAGSGVPGVEVVRRRDLVFAVNHTEDERPVPVQGTDLITGKPVGGRLGPGGYVVVRP